MSDRTPDTFAAIPLWFLAGVVPRIREMPELQVMLSFFRIQAEFESMSEPVSETRLLQDELLNQALRLEGAVRPPNDSIERGIELAVARDTLMRFSVKVEESLVENWLLLATPENRVKLERYRSGAISPPSRIEPEFAAGRVQRIRPGIFQRYEQNIGLVTPIIADRLVEAMELYPESWINDAIEAAVSYNRRNWRYIQRILETWATEGRTNEANQRYRSGSEDFDPERHISGEYAAIFRRRRRE